MRFRARSRASSALFVFALGVAGQAAHGQAIEVSKERSAPAPSLPFAAPPAPKPAPPPAPVKPSFILHRDQPVHIELQAWAKGQDWELLWYPPMSWRVLREADLSNAADVAAAVSEVIDILRDEGKPVRLKISDGNRVMEVFSSEVRND